MSVPPQNTTQPPPIVLTIPTQNDTKSEKEHILKLFPKRTILIFSIIQLVCAGLAGILQVRNLQWCLDYYIPLAHKPYVNEVSLNQDYIP